MEGVFSDGWQCQGIMVAGLQLRWLDRQHQQGDRLHKGGGDAVQILHVAEYLALDHLEGCKCSISWVHGHAEGGYYG